MTASLRSSVTSDKVRLLARATRHWLRPSRAAKRTLMPAIRSDAHRLQFTGSPARISLPRGRARWLHDVACRSIVLETKERKRLALSSHDHPAVAALKIARLALSESFRSTHAGVGTALSASHSRSAPTFPTASGVDSSRSTPIRSQPPSTSDSDSFGTARDSTKGASTRACASISSFDSAGSNGEACLVRKTACLCGSRRAFGACHLYDPSFAVAHDAHERINAVGSKCIRPMLFLSDVPGFELYRPGGRAFSSKQTVHFGSRLRGTL